jgi:tRNA-2-methylthio-N6-dimethylallyladenosine synthase
VANNSSRKSKKFFIQTFGCQMNVYDSDRIGQILTARHYRQVQDVREADLIFVNTCSVREKPEQKVYSMLGRLRALKKRNPNVIIGVGGCMAQQEGGNLLERVPYLDFALGTKELRRLPEILDQVEFFGKRGAATTLQGRMDPYESLGLCPSPGHPTAFVSIMQGCDNFCTFCVVPYVRGREVSRSSRDILTEIKTLCTHGVREVTLLGQNVNSYGKRKPGELGFVELLEAIQGIQGLERIRFTTSHPKDLSERLMQAFGRLSKLCEHIHLPLQSGSNRILKRMNRGYTKEEFLEKITGLRQACPGIRITSDLIVGFPGEENRDFGDTLEAIERVQFDDLFSFCYSDRPFAKASSFAGKVPNDTSRERLVILQKAQGEITRTRNKNWEGKEVEVLVEGPTRTDPQEKTGRSRANHIINFPGKSVSVGALVRLKIQKAHAHSFRGELLPGKN